MNGKIKDNSQVKKDMVVYYDRFDLESSVLEGGKIMKPITFTLTIEQRKLICQ